MVKGKILNQFDSFLSPAEVAKIFQVPIRTIQVLARTKKIPALKIGRLWRFREHDIRAWIEHQYGKPPEFPEIYEKAREIVNG